VTCWTNNQDGDLSKSENWEPLLNNESSEEGNKKKVKLHLNSLLIIVINFERAPLAAAQSSHVRISRWDESYVYNSLLKRIEACKVSIFTLKCTNRATLAS